MPNFNNFFKMQKSLLSIGIPAYRSVDLIREQISQYPRQSKFVQLLISDQTPSDLKPEVNISSLCSQLNNCTYFDYSGKSNNPIHNWNNCISNLQHSKYMQIRHHDDLIASPELSIPILFSSLYHSKSELLIMPHLKIVKKYEKNGSIYAKCIYHCHPIMLNFMLKLDYSILLFFNYIGPTSSLYYSSASPALFDTSLTWLVDCNWYNQMLKQAKTIQILSVCNFSQKNPNSITNTIQSHINQVNRRELKYLTSSWSTHKRLVINLFAILLKIVTKTINLLSYSINPVYIQIK